MAHLTKVAAIHLEKSGGIRETKSYLSVGGEFIILREGTTQGDPLAMVMYAIGTLPLIQKLQTLTNQVWYADVAAVGATIESLKNWWIN